MSFWSRVKSRMRKFNPWICGVLNFFAWGLGYLYARRKKLLGFALITFILVNLVASGGLASGEISTKTVLVIMSGTYLFVSFAFGRDAYLEAKAKNQEASG